METRLAEKDKTMEIRLAEKGDLDALKEIWALCFGDPEFYVDFYFKTRDWMHETAVLMTNSRPVSMLTMIPVRMMDVDGTEQSASMIFAVATHPDHQKLGYADQLLVFANRLLAEKQTTMSLLVPAEEYLFRFYGKRGYRNNFSIQEAKLKHSELARLEYGPTETNLSAAGEIQDANGIVVGIFPSEPAEYNRIRKNLLAGCAWLDYRDDEIRFEKQTAMMSGADLYAVCFAQSSVGCFYAERASEDLVFVKELLVPDEFLTAVLKSLAELLPAKEYIIRTPAGKGEVLGGIIRPFGMLRKNQSDGNPVQHEDGFTGREAYLGIAYD
jgi:ribosomal protein S18 acetylase RimI-like enzyme